MSADPAPARARAAAALIDMLPVLMLLVGALVVATVTAWPWWTPLVPLGLAVLWAVVLWQTAAADGRPPGKRLLGLAETTDTVGVESGSTPTPGRALGRLLLRGVLAVATVGIAGFSYRWDPAGRQRTWWDRALGTAVVEGPATGLADDHAAERWAPIGGDEDRGAAAPAAPPMPLPAPMPVPVSARGAVPIPALGGSSSPAGASGPADSAAPGAADVTRRQPPAVGPLPAASPPTRGGWTPSREPAAEAFLAPPLIGGSARAVPHSEPGSRAARVGAAADAAAGGPGIITRIDDTGRPVSGAASPPAGSVAPPSPAPAVSSPPAASPSVPAVSSPPAASPSVPAPPPAPASSTPAVSPSSAAVSSPKHRAAEWDPATRTAPSDPAERSGAEAAPTVRVPGVGAPLIWDTGRHVTLAGRVLIGRDPAAADGESVDHLLPVTTDSVGVSKTHLLLEIGVDGIAVTDRRSTNGVRVVHADGSVERCVPGVPLPLAAGDAVHFGGRHITIAG